MAEKKVGDIMHKGVIACRPDTPMNEVVRIVSDTDVHAIIVVDRDEHVQGVISHMDIIRLYGQDLTQHVAKEVMSAKVLDIDRDAPVEEAVKKMLEHQVHRLVVTERTESGKRPVGILSTTDVVRDMRGARWVWYMG